MTPTQALKQALDQEQTRSQTLEAVVKALQAELKAEKAKTTALQAQRDEVKDAARAALTAFDAPEADLIVYCTHEAEGRCDRVGTRCDDDVVRCDEHAWPRLQTLSYAPALRRLRALTKEEG